MNLQGNFARLTLKAQMNATTVGPAGPANETTSASAGATRFERILVAIDFSHHSLDALRIATERFAGPLARLILVNAVEAPEGLTEHVGLRGRLVDTLASDAQQQLHTLANTHRGLWQEVQTTVEPGKSTDVILAAAQAWNADLVVMGSHGKSSLSSVLFGGTTYHVARKVACSVMVLRKK
jgi:universal stress protein A